MENPANSDEPKAGKDPLKYPWSPPEDSGIMSGSRYLRIHLEPNRRLGQSKVEVPSGDSVKTESLNKFLVESNVAPVDSRVLVVSIGSNSSPEVLLRKFRKRQTVVDSQQTEVSTVVPFVRATIENVAIGHSAHVSAGGYIAAAPYAKQDAKSEVWASWLDCSQLDRLDATEPNYSRVLLGSDRYPLTLDNGEVPESFYIYVSDHELISQNSDILPLSQQEFILKWMVNNLPSDSNYGEPRELSDALHNSDELRGATKDALRRELLVSDSGLVQKVSSGLQRYGNTPSVQSELVGDQSSRGVLLRIEATSDNLSRGGEQCVVIHPDAREPLKLGTNIHGVVSALTGRPGQPKVLVRIFESDLVPVGCIQVDQIVRNGLGAEKQEYLELTGAKSSTHVAGNALLGSPNFVALRVQTADLSSVEQHVCLLEPLAMRFLGIKDGDIVVIEGIPLEGQTAVPRIRLRSCQLDSSVSNRRDALSGGGLESRFPDPCDAFGVFPDLSRIFLDSAARRALGVDANKLGVVRVRASRRSQLLTQMRELLLIVVLAFIGVISIFDDPIVVGLLLVVVLSISVSVVFWRLKSDLGLRWK